MEGGGKKEIGDDERLKVEEGGGEITVETGARQRTGQRVCPGNISRRSEENKDSSQSAPGIRC